MKILQPPGWKRPKGYSNGIAARGRLVFVAGMVGWTADERFESDDFADQFAQALRNIRDVLAVDGARPEHIARMTMYIVDKQEYLAAAPRLVEPWRAVMGRHYPVMAAVEVGALMEDRARLEVEATAVVPD